MNKQTAYKTAVQAVVFHEAKLYAMTEGDAIESIAYPVSEEQRRQELTSIWWECRLRKGFSTSAQEFHRNEIVYCRNTGQGVIVMSQNGTRFQLVSEGTAYDYCIVRRRLPASGAGSYRELHRQRMYALYTKDMDVSQAEYRRMCDSLVNNATL